jgi:RNA polymerase sigma-70 factor (ECF subfamily)
VQEKSGRIFANISGRPAVFKEGNSIVNKTPDKLNLEEDIPSLVRQSQAGSRGAFDCLVKRYQVCAMKTAVSILADADEAADVVQDGFVTAYLKIKKLKNPASFGPWLLRIVVNYAIERQKSLIKRKQRFKRTENLNHTASNHENVVNKKELQMAIQSAMSKLTKTQIRAIALFGIEELSHKEVADSLGCSPGAARWHVYRARQKLKILLKDYIR